MFLIFQELKMFLSHLTADTLRRLRDNELIPENKSIQHSYVKNIVDPPAPKVSFFLIRNLLLESVFKMNRILPTLSAKNPPRFFYENK